MVTLYDEAKVMEIHDYNVEQRGIEKVIHSLVKTMRDFSASKDATIEKLVSEAEYGERYHRNSPGLYP